MIDSRVLIKRADPRRRDDSRFRDFFSMFTGGLSPRHWFDKEEKEQARINDAARARANVYMQKHQPEFYAQQQADPLSQENLAKHNVFIDDRIDPNRTQSRAALHLLQEAAHLDDLPRIYNGNYIANNRRTVPQDGWSWWTRGWSDKRPHEEYRDPVLRGQENYEYEAGKPSYYETRDGAAGVRVSAYDDIPQHIMMGRTSNTGLTGRDFSDVLQHKIRLDYADSLAHEMHHAHQANNLAPSGVLPWMHHGDVSSPGRANGEWDAVAAGAHIAPTLEPESYVALQEILHRNRPYVGASASASMSPEEFEKAYPEAVPGIYVPNYHYHPVSYEQAETLKNSADRAWSDEFDYREQYAKDAIGGNGIDEAYGLLNYPSERMPDDMTWDGKWLPSVNNGYAASHILDEKGNPRVPMLPGPVTGAVMGYKPPPTTLKSNIPVSVNAQGYKTQGLATQDAMETRRRSMGPNAIDYSKVQLPKTQAEIPAFKQQMNQQRLQSGQGKMSLPDTL